MEQESPTCPPDRSSKILLVQVGTLSSSHPSFGVSVFFLSFQGWEDGTPPPHRDFKERCVTLLLLKKERKKTDNPREGWEDGTPPPHRDFKERGVMR